VHPFLKLIFSEELHSALLVALPRSLFPLDQDRCVLLVFDDNDEISLLMDEDAGYPFLDNSSTSIGPMLFTLTLFSRPSFGRHLKLLTFVSLRKLPTLALLVILPQLLSVLAKHSLWGSR